MRTEAGFRIDWEASRENWLAAEDVAFRKSHGLENAAIEVELVKVKNESQFTQLTFRVTNQSRARLKTAFLKVEAYGSDEAYLAQGSLVLKNLAPSDSTIDTVLLEDVKATQIQSWKAGLTGITIDLGDNKRVEAERYFVVKQKP